MLFVCIYIYTYRSTFTIFTIYSKKVIVNFILGSTILDLKPFFHINFNILKM